MSGSLIEKQLLTVLVLGQTAQRVVCSEIIVETHPDGVPVGTGIGRGWLLGEKALRPVWLNIISYYHKN